MTLQKLNFVDSLQRQLKLRMIFAFVKSMLVTHDNKYLFHPNKYRFINLCSIKSIIKKFTNFTDLIWYVGFTY